MKDNFENLLLQLSRSLAEEPPWELFLREMEAYFDCHNCALFLRPPTESDAGLLISQERTAASPSEIVETYFDSPFLILPEGEIWTLSKLRVDRESSSRFGRYLEFHQRKETTDIMALNLFDTDTGMSFYFRLIRYSHPKEFNEDDKAELHHLFPHIKSAVTLYCRIVAQQKQLYISDKTTTKLGMGFVVLKSNGQVLMMNSAAANMVRDKQGISVDRGRLFCMDKDGNNVFRRHLKLLADVAVEEDDYYLEIPTRGSNNGSLALMMRKFEAPPEFLDDSGHFVSLIIRDTKEKTGLSPDTLMKLFELTPAEALLTERLVLGDSLAEAAIHLGRSNGTVRAQLGAIFAKTGVHKQHQLISHIMHKASNYWP